MDKLKHFGINLVIVAFLGLINIYLALIIAIIASLGKELYDKSQGNKIDLKDILFDILGMICGVLTINIIK